MKRIRVKRAGESFRPAAFVMAASSKRVIQRLEYNDVDEFRAALRKL